MRKLRRSATLLALAIAACGGSIPAATASSPPSPPATHPCSTSDFAAQCVHPITLDALTATDVQIATQAVRSVYGVDFAWGGPRTCSAMRSLGVHFVIGYLSYDSGKNLGLSTVNEARRCGVATVVGWETTANRAAQGFFAGASDAREAGRQAAVLGNHKDAIWFAIDFDANGPEVYSYFKGAQSVLGARVNAYGGYRPLAYLHAHGAVGNLNFQTYAWSGGSWLPASIAPLQQYLNGNTFDNDRALLPNFGQFPAPAPPKPPAPKDPNHYLWFMHTPTGAPDERGTVQFYDFVRKTPKSHQAYIKREEVLLLQLAHNVWVAAHKDCCNGAFVLPAQWNTLHRGWRFQGLWARAHGKKIA